MGKSVEFALGSVKLTITFDTTDELKTALGHVEEIKKALKESLPDATTEATKTVRPQLQPFFDYDGGKLVMSRPPPTNIKKVCLALYVLGPQGALPREIAALSNIQNPSKDILHNASYKKYFRQLTNGRYVLKDEGYSFVTNSILTMTKEENQDATP